MAKKNIVIPSDLKLPVLIGTPKQIVWAEKIRQEIVSHAKFNTLDEKVLEIAENKKLFEKLFWKNRKEVSEKNEAVYWINWRVIGQNFPLSHAIIEYSDTFKNKPNAGWIKKEKE